MQNRIFTNETSLLSTKRTRKITWWAQGWWHELFNTINKEVRKLRAASNFINILQNQDMCWFIIPKCLRSQNCYCSVMYEYTKEMKRGLLWECFAYASLLSCHKSKEKQTISQLVYRSNQQSTRIHLPRTYVMNKGIVAFIVLTL
jgi:hypothetical protein